MSNFNVVLPSKPKIVREEGMSGVYEIDGLYPGYGHTLGNSLRRIILSSLPGAAVSKVKIKGVEHEFSSIDGVKEDVIAILLNLKRLRVRVAGDEPQVITIKAKGIKSIKAKDIDAPSQVEILNAELHIAELTDKNAELDMEITVVKGLGYVAKEVLEKERIDIGTISLDATFTPIRKVNYEVENMRIGDRTDFNRLRITIETDGTLTPNQALENSIGIMISQLKAIVGFKEEEAPEAKKSEESEGSEDAGSEDTSKEPDADLLKTRIDTIGLSPRTVKALTAANIRTIGGLARKKEDDILDVEGLGTKGIQEIKKVLSTYGISLK
ncbi:MAG: DNA-directed polymerase subunit alpha, DNA-directed polymerase subunit alpha [Candidatus Taylorbacteria bacterium]|nr:DNA-directed polymerase subunit alpha, DNA-directed polymerase subunit alpha [Candidatus Taylorbacteria bacterium]